MLPNKEQIIVFKPGTVIFREGDPPDFAYILMSGHVEISARGPDGRVILNQVAPKQLFGDLALFENTPRTATATTLSGCEVLSISKQQFGKKLDVLDPFTRYWILYLVDRVKELSQRVRVR